jgi:hypothetical protein
MAVRIFAAVLVVLFGYFLYLASGDVLRLVEDRRFGDVFLLLFCVIVCVGWIGFLATLVLKNPTPESSSVGTPVWRDESV